MKGMTVVNALLTDREVKFMIQITLVICYLFHLCRRAYMV